ncbi:ubiquitin carboxyl-terminal hydrolase Usp2 [Anopheles nili]|uniref:ubiquitin carboxyl-terminal hydrolase Usp2 n=1 Tax=Anopheles nili TaxID=185578 RepID=UPI00237BDC0E|nr:ubiquitin carboxyl-terminal hydrolase Usp2 [Anopheles nili]
MVDETTKRSSYVRVTSLATTDDLRKNETKENILCAAIEPNFNEVTATIRIKQKISPHKLLGSNNSSTNTNEIEEISECSKFVADQNTQQQKLICKQNNSSGNPRSLQNTLNKEIKKTKNEHEKNMNTIFNVSCIIQSNDNEPNQIDEMTLIATEFQTKAKATNEKIDQFSGSKKKNSSGSEKDDQELRFRNSDSSRNSLGAYMCTKGKKEGLCGLWNIGNTCFMNSMLQCLSHTQELTAFLRNRLSDECGNNKDKRILIEYTKLINGMWSGLHSCMNPSEFKYAFSSKHRMYSGSAQQDAQEFLRFFIDSLHGALNNTVKREALGDIDDNMDNRVKANMLWDWYSKAENSMIKDLFVGQLRSTLKCTYCNLESTMFDPFWDLS